MKARDSSLKEWIPRPLRSTLNRAIGASIVYRGPFASWDEARASTSGYAEGEILCRIVDATQQVLRGEARYEQDGIVFHDAPPASHALASLLAVAAAEGGTLRVVDFGGSLASHYLRWLPFLTSVPSLQWCVVEQPHFVAAGRQLFADVVQVRFAATLDEIRDFSPNAVLASSVLQYLEFPLDALQALAMLEARLLVLDRTPFSMDGGARIFAQKTPAQHGHASYPLWMLSRNEVSAILDPHYIQRASFASTDCPIKVSGLRAAYVGGAWWRAK